MAYDIYVSINNGPWNLWLAQTTNTCANFQGQTGNTYGFYSIAHDGAGEVQQTPASANTTTLVAVPPKPTITCTSDIITNQATGECSQIVSFTPVVTGSPTPTLVCELNGNPITSPFSFPVGTNLVICTVSNVVGSQSCSFTVTVVNTNPPVAGPFSMGPKENTPESVPIAKMLLVDQSPSGTR